MSDIPIDFLAGPGLTDKFPHPYPARDGLPTWYLQMSGETDPPSQFGTVKRCPPFLDAMSCGYIIPLPVDLRVALTATTVGIETNPKFSQPIVVGHPARQFPGAPFPNRPVLKFHNPWIVKTPPGYSCLFVAPLNRFEAPFVALSGVVDTDKYYSPVAFPAIWMPGPGTTVEVKAGTPLVQVIPFKRETIAMKVGEWDPQLENQQHEEIKANPHSYREMWWEKKKYT